MTETLDELRAKLDGLRAQHSALFSELVPLTLTGASGAALWRDSDVALWLGADVDLVRQRIVTHLTGEHGNFLVDEHCCAALLGVRQVLALTTGNEFKTPRMIEIAYAAARIELAAEHLRQLGALE